MLATSHILRDGDTYSIQVTVSSNVQYLAPLPNTVLIELISFVAGITLKYLVGGALARFYRGL